MEGRCLRKSGPDRCFAVRNGTSALDGAVHLVEQPPPVGELEVLGQVSIGLLARSAVQGHVERDQAGAVVVATVSPDLWRGLGGNLGNDLARSRDGDLRPLL